jgi:hypothetical protein
LIGERRDTFILSRVNLDPYAPPAAPSEAPSAHLPLREIVVGWEKLRLLYNGLLLLPGAAMFWYAVDRGAVPPVAALGSCALVAIGANGCFLLGPLAELYLRGIFRRGEPFGRGRQLLFGLGLLASGCVFVLVFLVLADGGVPNMDPD